MVATRYPDTLPPHSPDAERGVLGCCLLNFQKALAAMKAGVTSGWFYDARHAEIFTIIASLAGHFVKGNPSAKETIDRISGSGVFARDPDSLVIFTKHEQEGAFTVEMVLRNLPPVDAFVVEWKFPLFVQEKTLDPARLKKAGGRPPTHTEEMLLECLGDQRLTSTEWKDLAADEYGVSETRFYVLLKSLEDAGKVLKSRIDRKWQLLPVNSRNYDHEKDQY